MKNRNGFLWIGTGLLCIITFYPLFRLGIVHGDDLAHMLWELSDIKNDSMEYARNTGRFYFWFAIWIYKIPFLVDSALYYHTMLVLPLVSSFALFAAFIGRIFKTTGSAIATALLICSFFQIHGGYSATAGYPFYFSFSMSLVLLSLHLLLSYFRNRKYKYLIFSSLILAVSTLFYETYVLFYLLIFLMILGQYPLSDVLKKPVLKKIAKELLPFVFWGVVYVTVYIWFYLTFQSNYQGNTLSSDFDLALVFKALTNMIFYSLPLAGIWDYQIFITEYSTAFKQSESLFVTIITQAGMVAYIKALIALAVFGYLAQAKTCRYNKRVLLYAGLISALFVMMPHLPLALSEKYSQEITNTYVSTYFSFFAVIGSVFCFSVLMMKYLSNHKRLERLAKVIFGIALFFITLSTQFLNERVSHDLRTAQMRFTIMEEMLKEEYIPQNSQVYLDQLHYTSSYFGRPITRQASQFDYFAHKVNRLNLFQHLDYQSFYNQFSEVSDTVYLIYFSQAVINGDCQMMVVPVRGEQLSSEFRLNRCDELIVGYLSNAKIFGISLVTDTPGVIMVSGSDMVAMGTFHCANLRFLSKPPVSVARVEGAGIYPSTVRVSQALFRDVPVINAGKFSRRYEKRAIRKIEREIRKHQGYVRFIQQKADEQGIGFKEALRNDAYWILYNDFNH